MTQAFLNAARRTSRARVQAVFAAALVTALATGAAGCSSGDSSTSPTTVSGQYLLETIQRRPIPVKIYDGPYADPDGYSFRSYVVTVKGGEIDLDADGTYHLLMRFRDVFDGDSRDAAVDTWGTYELSGSRIVLTRDDGHDGGSGTVDGNEVMIQMTIVYKGAIMPYVFRR